MSTTKYSITWSSKVRSSIVHVINLMSYKYIQRVLGCALGPDLALLPHGDMTEVGEKGKVDFVIFCVIPALIIII